MIHTCLLPVTGYRLNMLYVVDHLLLVILDYLYKGQANKTALSSTEI